MTAGDNRIVWDSAPTDLADLSGLASLADQYIHRSGRISDASPTAEFVRISYSLPFNATPVAGDSIRFYIACGDDAASNEIWDGGIAATAGVISSAADRAAVEAALFPVREVAWKTSHGVTFKGSFDIYIPGPSWQVLTQPNGEAFASSGAIIRYRYFHHRILQS